MEILVFLVCVVAWVGIGFFTALIRWKYIEGAEKISAGVASRETTAACEELILFGGDPAGFAKIHYENTKQNAKSQFFGASIAFGPIGTAIFLADLGWHTLMEKIKS